MTKFEWRMVCSNRLQPVKSWFPSSAWEPTSGKLCLLFLEAELRCFASQAELGTQLVGSCSWPGRFFEQRHALGDDGFFAADDADLLARFGFEADAAGREFQDFGDAVAHHQFVRG